MAEPQNSALSDTVSPAKRSAIMRAVKSKDTGPERALRRALHKAGRRYRLHDKRLPGAPDLVFPSKRKVIFVHGCFWHGHDCRRGARVPKTNRDYWLAKIDRNRTRDARRLFELEALGWDALIIWECELKDLETAVRTAQAFLDAPLQAGRKP
ncbi:MAG: very short patch repair endonuclease [Pseudomonadota bacterium]